MSPNSFEPTRRESEPCWGSVMAQQPTYFASVSLQKGATTSCIRSSLPLLEAKVKGKGLTPKAMAKSALPQPISSVRI